MLLLEVGVTITNKELVEMFGNEKQIAAFEKNGKLTNSMKNAVLKQFDSLYEYEITKIGRKQAYTITKVYDEPKKIVDKRANNKGGNNKVFIDDFKTIMVDTMYKNRTEEMLLSKVAMFKMANLVNDNYKIGRSNIKKLSEILDTPLNVINDFYDNNQTKLKNTIESSLKSCRSESILFYESVIALAINKAYIAKNELGEPIVNNKGEVKYTTVIEYREATKEEKQLILNYENEVKKEMGFEEYDSNKTLFLSGRWKEFKKRVERKLKERETNIRFYYEAYKITWNNNLIDKIHSIYCKDLVDIIYSKENINKNIIKSINKTNKTRSNNMAKGKDIVIDNFLEHNEKLTNTLIDVKAESIREKLKSR